MRRRTIAGMLATGAFLIWLCYGTIDIEVIRWAQAQKPWLKPIASVITELGISTWWIVGSLLAWLYFRFYAKDGFRALRARFFLIAVVTTGIAVIPFKLLFGKARPDELIEKGIYGFHWFSAPDAYDYHSFPSGHTTTAFTVATALALMFPKQAPLFYIFAVLVALSRIAVLYHYPTDIIAGAMFGSALTLLLFSFDRISFKKR